ncbi:MAG: glycoside hydrolase family 18 protein, partial [Parachlamydiaceae bacterium]|nr:glycoside hydrolase family 18 protein [Parachlamydiaceae bacterium]
SEEKSYAGNFYQLHQLKKQRPNLKTLISLGGWTLSNPFSEMASTAARRENFAQNCVDFCKKYDFDGIDIDWEYPGFADHSGRPEDTVNFTLLLKTVSEKLRAQNPALLLTIAAPAGPNHYKNIEVSKIHLYLDWINIMGYDFHGPWGGDEDALTNHLAAIMPTEYGHPLFNVSSVIDYYISQGVPEEKIVLGLPLYGRSFASAKDTPSGLYSTYNGPGYATTEEVGYVFYSDIQKNLLNTYTSYWDPKALGAYIYNHTTKDFISYDSEQSWTLKAQIIKDRGLGGAMVWELGMDTMPDWKMMTHLNNQLK